MVGAGKEGLSFEENTCLEENTMIMEWCYKASFVVRTSPNDVVREAWEILNADESEHESPYGEVSEEDSDALEYADEINAESPSEEDECDWVVGCGWASCYWCHYWTYNPYIINWIGRPLCDNCFDWHLGWFGGPYEPTGTQRATRLIGRWFPQLQAEEVIANVAEFLLEWHEP